jgi:outer membrane protein TolC
MLGATTRLLAVSLVVAACSAGPSSGEPPVAPSPAPARLLTIQDSIALALESNRARPVSRLSAEIAEAQLQQALSAYWPDLSLKAAATRLDQDPNFVFPPNSYEVPPQTIVVQTPAGQLPITVPQQSVTVPAQDVKLLDRDSLVASLNAVYPLYTGGLRPALVRQARSGLEAARQEVRRTDLQVVHDVTRFHWGAVLAKRLVAIGSDALARMEVTLELTENLYKGGSGRVKKTDYLRNRTVVEALRSTVVQLRTNEALARAALRTAIGLGREARVEPAEAEIPFRDDGADLERLVGAAYTFNPDWLQMEQGLKAAEARVDEKRAGYFPVLALVGRLTRIENSYDQGLVTPQNRSSWSIGLALDVPLFRGFRTEAEVREARARFGRLKEQEVLLREGLALQVTDAVLRLAQSAGQRKALAEAARSAEENRDLTERAYQAEMADPKDVLEAQLLESVMKAGNEKVLFDHAEARSRLDLVVGTSLEKLLDARR